MARITKIEATKDFIEKKKTRVAAYARVSTRSDEQLRITCLIGLDDWRYQQTCESNALIPSV